MEKRYERDYCTCFPEDIAGIYIGDCCKKHDNEVGEKGTYNPITPHINFYNNLKEKNVPLHWCVIITLGGTIFTWVRQPIFWYKIYKYRKEIKNG